MCQALAEAESKIRKEPADEKSPLTIMKASGQYYFTRSRGIPSEAFQCQYHVFF